MNRWYTLTLRTGALENADAVLRSLAASADAERATARVHRDLDIVSVRAPEGSVEKLRRSAGVAFTYEAYSVANSDDGLWYVNLIDALDYILHDASGGAPFTVVNASLQPPAQDLRPFSASEPLVHALSICAGHGIAFVFAAGNYGQRGDGSMSNWAQPSWVISAAACDAAGTSVLPFSGRGHPDQFGPTVSSEGTQQPVLSSQPGTSYAAPRVTDIVMFTAAFIGSVMKFEKRELAEVRTEFPSIASKFLRAMAKRIPNTPAHVGGAGVVSYESALAFLRSMTPPLFRELTGVETSTAAVKAAADLARDAVRLIETSPVVRCAIDLSFEWSGPAFVPGLIQVPRGLLYREVHELADRGELRIATNRKGLSFFHEIAILRGGSVRQALTVSKSGRAAFQTISQAIAESEPGDLIQIEAGIYPESFAMKSRLTLVGEKGAIIRPPAGSSILLKDCRSTAMIGLTVDVSGPRREACLILESQDVVLKDCRLRSAEGNGIMLFASQRVALWDTEVEGGINGLYTAMSRGIIFRNSGFRGQQTGMFLLQVSGSIENCSAEGKTGEGAFAIASKMPILGLETLEVYVHPIGKNFIPAMEVNPSAIVRNDLTGGIAREFYVLRVTGSRFAGGRIGLAADDFHFVTMVNSTAAGPQGQLALIEKYQHVPPPSAGAPVGSFLAALGGSMTNIVLRPLR